MVNFYTGYGQHSNQHKPDPEPSHGCECCHNVLTKHLGSSVSRGAIRCTIFIRVLSGHIVSQTFLHRTNGQCWKMILKIRGWVNMQVEFNPKHYLTMTKSGIIRVNEYRLGNQELTSPRKDAVYLAQRFLYQAEVNTQNRPLLLAAQ